MRAIVFAFVLILSTVAAIAAQSPEGGGQTYEEMRAQVIEYYRTQDYAKAAALLERGIDLYADHLRANAYNLALMCGPLGRLDDGVRALNRYLESGGWFGRHDFANEAWDPYRDHSGFKQVLARSEALLVEARKSSRPERVVVLPKDYDPRKRYPLFLALHGGGENIEAFRPHWHSSRMESEFIVAYLQSSLLVRPDGYDWTEDISVTLREIKDSYEAVSGEHLLAEGRTIVGGFSSGGVASLETAISGVIPVEGFIALCPGMPEGATEDRLKEAGGRGLRGALLTTEMDHRVEEQARLDSMLTAAGIDHTFEVTPNIGHWYPEDLPEKLDRAIRLIRGEARAAGE